MNQTIFMIVVTSLACIGSFAVRPFIGLAVYIFYAIIRPQLLWQWSLPWGVSWSLYVAIAAILSLMLTGPRTPVLKPGQCPPGRFQFTWAHRLFYMFGITLILSYLLAYKQSVGDQHMDEYLKLYVMYTVGMFCIRTVNQVFTIAIIYALSLGFVCYEVNYEYLVKGYMWVSKIGFGGHDNNGAGMLFAMAVPICAFAWEYYRKWYRWLFALLIPVIIHAVMMTYSRGAMLSLIVASPFWILRGTYRKQKILLGVGVLCCVPFLAGEEIQNRFFSISKAESDGSAQSRFVSWEIGLRIAMENPIFGCGVRNSPLFTFEYGADVEGRVIHNQYLQLAADCGFIGAGLYIAIVVLSFWNFQKVARLARQYTDADSRKAYATALGLQGALVTFAFGAVFLSCEAFEPQYYLFLASAMLRIIYVTGVKESLAANPVAVSTGVPKVVVNRVTVEGATPQKGTKFMKETLESIRRETTTRPTV